MKTLNKEQISRLALTVVILLSGLAMIPFVDLPVGAIGWETLAGVYEPDLSVNEDSGAPGSIFAFTGSNYPPNSVAFIHFNGQARGNVMTDAGGTATFKLDTVGAPPGIYNITLEVDINASATESIELDESGSVVTPPAGFEGPTFFLGFPNPIFLPTLFR
jgi:hypothetical protein